MGNRLESFKAGGLKAAEGNVPSWIVDSKGQIASFTQSVSSGGGFAVTPVFRAPDNAPK